MEHAPASPSCNATCFWNAPRPPAFGCTTAPAVAPASLQLWVLHGQVTTTMHALLTTICSGGAGPELLRNCDGASLHCDQLRFRGWLVCTSLSMALATGRDCPSQQTHLVVGFCGSRRYLQFTEVDVDLCVDQTIAGSMRSCRMCPRRGGYSLRSSHAPRYGVCIQCLHPGSIV